MNKIIYIKRIIISIVFILIGILIYYSPIKIDFDIRYGILGLLTGAIIWLICYFILRFSKKELQKARSESHEKKIKKVLFDKSGYFYLFFVLYPNTILEELFFRSYVFAFTNKFCPIFLSVLINMALFYLIHFDKRVIQLAVSTLLYCLLVIYTNSITPSILAHLSYNTIVFFTRNKNRKIIK